MLPFNGGRCIDSILSSSQETLRLQVPYPRVSQHASKPSCKTSGIHLGRAAIGAFGGRRSRVWGRGWGVRSPVGQ
jgi:hypothetical protein